MSIPDSVASLTHSAATDTVDGSFQIEGGFCSLHDRLSRYRHEIVGNLREFESWALNLIRVVIQSQTKQSHSILTCNFLFQLHSFTFCSFHLFHVDLHMARFLNTPFISFVYGSIY